ncbi:MAG TPA: AraC family transcriptional regulator [Cytophagales bacterium]|nr:AraC family transcriptional regulator [Cytophagales bacterium]HRG09722.1 helix-turn-helix domain-containing protein [Cyclobacteriaceae bacterium]
MSDSSPQDTEFLKQLSAKIEENLANEQFGVSELADALNMSRSNLLRKVKKATNLSVSQLISQARLTKGMELLRAGSLNVSEVAHQVGFSSTSYFIKCFRESYGYPPGEVGKRANESETIQVAPPPVESKRKIFAIGIAALLLVAIAWAMYHYWPAKAEVILEKSIAVLPFKNDSNDSTNVYLINGLMESTLNNLQKIKDLRVISRTSVEKYRNNDKTIPEMANELNVTYFVEGSGQKMGDRIVLTIQLIDGATDRHLWSRQYRRETKDIFALQQEISNDIAEEIQAVITPDEKNRIQKVPTQNLEAYDAFLKGVDLLERGGTPNLIQSLVHFDEAISKDNTFALAYACAGMACYYLDMFQAEKRYVDKLGAYADKAVLHDPSLGESLMAKGMYYLNRKEYKEALPYLERAHEYNPNSVEVLGLLTDFYYMYLPNTGKYLEYALKGLKLNATSGDSVAISYFHLRLGNALIQAGFVDQALEHIDKSLEYNPENAFSRYVRAFVLYAKEGDLKHTRELLQIEFQRDTNRFDILQDIGKVSYYLKDYEAAYEYYKRFNYQRETRKLDAFEYENLVIGRVYELAGETKKAKEFYERYRQYVEHDQTAYKHIGLAVYYCQMNDSAKALEHLRLFTQEDNIQYWVILFMDKGPELTETEASPEFKALLKEVERKFWANHEKLKGKLEEQGLL